jgi:hypothetical protein
MTLLGRKRGTVILLRNKDESRDFHSKTAQRAIALRYCRGKGNTCKEIKNLDLDNLAAIR